MGDPAVLILSVRGEVVFGSLMTRSGDGTVQPSSLEAGREQQVEVEPIECVTTDPFEMLSGM
eukprot:7272947-Alexandrium_andersonii.AAC.1